MSRISHDLSQNIDFFLNLFNNRLITLVYRNIRPKSHAATLIVEIRHAALEDVRIKFDIVRAKNC